MICTHLFRLGLLRTSLLLVGSTAIAVPLSADEGPPAPSAEIVETLPRATGIERGLDYLLTTQNKNGSWGSGVTRRPVEILADVPGSHQAFRVGATALCVLALLKSPGRREACLQTALSGLEYLLQHSRVRRPNPTEHYNVWAFGYSLQTFCLVLTDERFAEDLELRTRVRTAAASLIEALALYQTLDGGWGYYDFEAGTYRPSGSSTSFTTATVLIALHSAQACELEVDPRLLERARRAVRRLRKADGSYVYGTYAQYRPEIGYNQVKGSLGRTPTCDLALWLYGEDITRHELRRGVERLFAHHRFFDLGRKRPMPHESWYYNSGYYFYYGHYYTARVIRLLAPEHVERLAAENHRLLLERQERDGSWWDFPFYGYHKPYGTALALLALYP